MTSTKRTRPYPNRTNASHWITLLGALLLSACASKPVPPDWQTNAFAALKGFSSAYLKGNTRLADFEFARAKSEIASTGRADLLARAELTRCAVRVASLELDQCAGYQPLALEAGPDEQAYAAFLTGQWRDLDVARLPAAYRAMASVAATGQPGDPQLGALAAIEDPLSRLIAAGALLQSSRLTSLDIAAATDTASSQGWRRPLLAWLGVQLKRANDAQDPQSASRLQRRIDLVLQGAPAAAP
ncbi:MAG: hypothetical protein GZ093_09725 [Rhodoferax sp.]|uniref:hypothetical protein n=1 Tax=Rhodoferax sp. TaxID=50421 RepID=UPI0014007475|nr:hypothetical protein [Rhodoferax sp.]NDP39006.1 hypothetical protein [Rhodoferax sp.]